MRRILSLALVAVILAALVAPVLAFHGVAEATLPTRGNEYIFAAVDSSVADKALADTVCDGINDQDDLEAQLATDTNFVFKAGSYAWDDVATLNEDAFTLTGESGAHIYRNADTTGILVQDSNDVVINGLEMSDNGTSSLYYLIRFNGSTDVIVTGTTLHDMENGIFVIANTTTHVKSSNVTIESNTIYNYHYSGVLLGNGVEYAYVQSNEFYGGTMTGSNLYAIATQMMGESDTTVPYVEYVWIQDNYVHDQDAWEGIDSHGGNHIYVLDNTVEDVVGFGISVHTSMAAGAGVTTNTDWVVTGNTVTNTTEFAVSVANTLTDFTVTAVEVSNNNINGWDWRGIHIQAEASGSLLQDVTVDSNVITNHSSSYTTGAGIHIYRNTVGDATSGDITVTNNTVNGSGATANAYFGIRVQRMLSVYQANNTVTNCTVSISLEDCTLGTPTATLVSIAITPATLTLSAGNTQQFAASGTYSDNSVANLTTTVTWNSSNPSGASISSAGLLTGVAGGSTTTVTATYAGVTSNSVSVTITVIVTLSSIAVTPSAAADVPSGSTYQLTATGTYSDNSTANLSSSAAWSSSNPAAATVSATGLVTGLAVGGVTNVTASLSGKISNTVVITVTAAGGTPTIPQPVYTTDQIVDISAFENLAESGDVAIVFRWDLSSYSTNGTYPETPASLSIIFQFYDTDGVTLLSTASPYVYAPFGTNGYGQGVSSFYFSAADNLTTDLPYLVRIQQSPLYFSNPTSANYTMVVETDWDDTTQDDMYDWFIQTCDFLLVEYPTVNLKASTDIGLVFSTYGEAYFRAAVPGIQALCPQLFYVQDFAAADMTVTPYNLTLQNQYSIRMQGSEIKRGADRLMTHFGLSGYFGLGFLVLAACIASGIYTSRKGWGLEPGLIGASIIGIAGAVLIGNAVFTIVMVGSLIAAIALMFTFIGRRA